MKQYKQTVLAFIDWYRPGYKAGGTITAFGNFVDYLEDQLEFKIVTRHTDYLDSQPYESVISDCWVPLSQSHVYYLSKTTYDNIKKIMYTNDCDWLYVNGIFSFYFSILPVMLSGKKKCMVNPHGMLSNQAFSVKSLKKRVFLFMANLLGLYKNTIFHVANENEAIAVRARIKKYKDIRIVNQLPRKTAHHNDINMKKSISEPMKFVTVSRISSEKGLMELLKGIATVEHSVILDIYGAIYDEIYWQECQTVISDLPTNIEVNYKGSIDGNFIIDTLKNYHFFALLSKGENFGHAILEALTAGCPVIISNNTPWKQLQEKGVGWDIPVDNMSIVAATFKKALQMSNEDYQRYSSQAKQLSREFSENPELIMLNLQLFN